MCGPRGEAGRGGWSLLDPFPCTSGNQTATQSPLHQRVRQFPYSRSWPGGGPGTICCVVTGVSIPWGGRLGGQGQGCLHSQRAVLPESHRSDFGQRLVDKSGFADQVLTSSRKRGDSVTSQPTHPRAVYRAASRGTSRSSCLASRLPPYHLPQGLSLRPGCLSLHLPIIPFIK